ncbi:MAG: formylglycine-generating enzyme family protein [Ferrovibrionaceae bacterium]
MTACPPGMVWLPGGSFVMGSDDHYPEERPAHRREVAGFWIDRAPVTVAQFAAFVAATGHVTLAETLGGSAVFRQPRAADLRRPDWWCWQPGTDWRGEGDLPVVHVGHADAEAYAAWAGKRLPSEAQWEYAAQGADYPGRPANVWQGYFPTYNARVRQPGPSRTGEHPANDHGLFDMIGNVWEWTRDVFAAHGVGLCCGGGAGEDARVIKGGSYLCAANYCARYRAAARLGQPVDSPTGHIGFRCVLEPG